MVTHLRPLRNSPHTCIAHRVMASRARSLRYYFLKISHHDMVDVKEREAVFS
jgi:hypothetical protein